MFLQYGTSNPDKIDVIGFNNGTCYLWIVQSTPIDESNLLLLQEKINNYLTFILEGQLLEEFPDSSDMPIIVRIVLQYDATGVSLSGAEKS